MKKNKLLITSSLLAATSVPIVPLVINQTNSQQVETNNEDNQKEDNSWLIWVGVGSTLFLIGLILLIVALATKSKDKKNKVVKSQQQIVVNKQQARPAIATIPCKTSSPNTPQQPPKTPIIKK